MSDAETARRVAIGTAVMDLRGWRLWVVYVVVVLLTRPDRGSVCK